MKKTKKLQLQIDALTATIINLCTSNYNIKERLEKIEKKMDKAGKTLSDGGKDDQQG